MGDTTCLNDMPFYYFAYGSNMLTERLKADYRCPGARVCGYAFAEGTIIEFSKRSVDGSGKATLVTAAGQRTPGVLFKIPEAESRALDRAEGARNGYQRCGAFPVHRSGSAAIVQAVTYIAKSPEANLKPYDWYLAIIIAGAQQHGLGVDYIAKLQRVPYKQDYDHTRKDKAIATIKAAGYDYEEVLGSA